ncbi:MAG TPA: hypothetical protein VFM07_08190, partial [Intrasporangium sp.]|nr:hypothetical protein [Intrasporangium sp.]
MAETTTRMCVPKTWWRRVSQAGHRDEGQIGLLILGLFSIVALLIVGAIDVTAAQLARMRILD